MYKITISSGHGVFTSIGGHCVDGICPGSRDIIFHVKRMFPYAASFGSSPISSVELNVTDANGVIGHDFSWILVFTQRPALQYTIEYMNKRLYCNHYAEELCKLN